MMVSRLETQSSPGFPRQVLHPSNFSAPYSFCVHFSKGKAAVPTPRWWEQRTGHRGHSSPRDTSSLFPGCSWGTAWLPANQVPRWCCGSCTEM